MRILNKKIIFAVTGIFFFALFLVRVKHNFPETIYHTVTISRSMFKQEILVAGKLEAKEKVDVGAQVSGQLKSINVNIGEHVIKNQLLAIIDPEQAENQIKAQEASLAALFAQRRQALATLKLCQSRLARQRQLIRTHSISQEDFESAVTDFTVAQEQVNTVDAQIQNQKALNAAAKTSLSFTHIASPIEGVVTAIQAAEGQTLVATQQAPTLMTVSNLKIMLVRAQVSEADIIRLRTGLRAWFTVLGDTETRYEGKLKAILPTPETVSNATFYDVLFEVPNPDGVLRLGMTAQIHIELRQDQNVLTIPLNALEERTSDGSYQVSLLRDGKAVRTNVTIGVQNDTDAEVIRGITDGDEVIVSSLPDRGNQ
ncbi:macrolide transporter subunit MacA [Pantoea sp. Bo_2]|uniref:Macrolide transporter subunit MacA n=1 Tax=Candidatus Pantoea gossypiicola TaxID=2608008 RepID=A0AB34CBZ2_9GAMM|nr:MULTISPECIES: macrolide transporter subunit MacA [Pantoea]KAA5920956.1 macrolide transporter subunit MacA [Pantoea sp. VH_8]KAA5928515.1 macrolide transporter subunit MacA [Pantoea sp. VH_4]KAA5937505.1 macrolide transporter subunit MacA [Pantoea sp. VH_3]KAA5948097.1 macrolide transporter subunit MacA [Pantoea sp. VH_25]KAA5948545.1 macrolide transporter subunit MacA [Pantoea sp. VH_24]